MKKFPIQLIFVAFLLLGIFGMQSVDALSAKPLTKMVTVIDVNQYDSVIYEQAKIWHGSLPVKDFAIMIKGHCMQESGMNEYATREEAGYLTGTYQKVTKRSATAIQKYLISKYGIYESVFTIEVDLSRSFGLAQIMGERAYELGWIAQSFYDDDNGGLLNVSVGLYYGAKLMNINLKRYDGNMIKAISAYNAGSYTTRNNAYVNKVLGFMKRFEHDFDRFE